MSLIIIFFLSLSFIYSINDEVLIKIDNKVITKNDFIKRAEYTIRPSYCRSDNYIHKKIILNSLIAEKLLALEIESKISVDQLNNDFLMGIKEQWMREIMLKDEIYNEIEIDSLSVHNDFVNSSKEYTIQYLSLNSDSISKQISYLLNDSLSFEDVSYNILKLNVIVVQFWVLI